MSNPAEETVQSTEQAPQAPPAAVHVDVAPPPAPAAAPKSDPDLEALGTMIVAISSTAGTNIANAVMKAQDEKEAKLLAKAAEEKARAEAEAKKAAEEATPTMDAIVATGKAGAKYAAIATVVTVTALGVKLLFESTVAWIGGDDDIA